ncbi:hypothetical protein [Planctobacterium marinum]|uniref:hypothetical protein n=1 Tax=Planctobacterium marinum TaxID=1631968 RepID=UPI001E29A091|nr:hypothetical protein [Planctobacterium marinum]MCC2607725.1 hypothetical protein [Planctobacterium marinum]
MKLNVDFSKLQQSIALMGAEACDFQIDSLMPEANFQYDQTLIEGIELKFDQIQTQDGLISTNGRQVLLYIPDHQNVDSALANGSQGNKFHVAECGTIIEMRDENAGDRYIVTANLSGKFNIYGKSRKQKKDISGEAELDVCRRCLSFLNYKGYANASTTSKNEIVNNFSLEEFFSTYSSMFKHLPREQFSHRYRGYDDDFDELSRACRKRANYRCQNCMVDLSQHKQLLDAHHHERIKANSSIQDLVALCKDCHRKEPFHQHMPLSRENMQKINRLRHEQGLINPSDWQSVRKFSDPALFGFIQMCESLNLPKPHVHYPVSKIINGSQGYIDLAWPEKRVGVKLDPMVPPPRWRIMDFKYVLKVLNNKKLFQDFSQYMSTL